MDVGRTLALERVVDFSCESDARPCWMLGYLFGRLECGWLQHHAAGSLCAAGDTSFSALAGETCMGVSASVAVRITLHKF